MQPSTASIVIVNYNYARFLPQAIESALRQTHSACEVVVVDDGSSDASPEIIRGYGPRVLPVLKSNGGEASAVNAGFRHTRGDVVFFLDADDTLAPGALETVLAAWRPGTAMMQYRTHLIDAQGVAFGLHPHRGSPLDSGDVRPLLLRHGSYATTVNAGLAFARQALAQVMPVPEDGDEIPPDGYLTRAVPFFGTVQALDVALAHYRRHSANRTRLAGGRAQLARRLHTRIAWMQREFDVVRRWAQRLGLAVASDLGEHDPAYLEYRLCSLALDPAAHPLAGDRRLEVLRRYMSATCRRRDIGLRRRAKLALWGLGLGLLPGAAPHLVNWRAERHARPPLLRRALEALRGWAPDVRSSPLGLLALFGLVT